jgi:hypothetical protein
VVEGENLGWADKGKVTSGTKYDIACGLQDFRDVLTEDKSETTDEERDEYHWPR